MSIPFTQFLMPHGRRKQVTINRSPEIELMAHKLIAAGYVFEIEMLSDYQTISMEVVDPISEECMACSLCRNGPTEGQQLGVPKTVDKIVRLAFEKLPLALQSVAVTVPEDKPKPVKPKPVDYFSAEGDF